MKRRTAPQFSAMLGLGLVLLALWAAAMPVLGNGDSILGGHEYRWYVDYQHGGYVGCSSTLGCDYCEQTRWESCSAAYDDSWNFSWQCGGGSILIAVRDFEYKETYPVGLAGCTEGYYLCEKLQHADCQL